MVKNKIKILVGPEAGKEITREEWNRRKAILHRNICRCMGAMFDNKPASNIALENL